MTPPRILIAGIGNIFLGDDAFGSEVAHRLLDRPRPDGVHIVDFGIRGFDLTYALLDNYDAVILIDAAPRGDAPGTLYVIEPDMGDGSVSDQPNPVVETHAMDPVRVLRLAVALGCETKRILVVGCEPESVGTDEDGVMGLSPPVQRAVAQALPLVDSLVAKFLEELPGKQTQSAEQSRL